MDEKVITTAEGTETPTTEPTETVKTEQTISELTKEVKDEPKPDTVGLDKFIKEKKARQQAEKDLADLKAKIESGRTDNEITEDIKAIAEEHDIDVNFLSKLTKTIKAQTEKDLEDKLSSKLKPIEEKEKKARIDEIFNKQYGLAIEQLPEYKDIVNSDVIKNLSLLPQNGNKTFVQLIEETYGNAVSGKRTIEKTTPGGGKESETLDFNKARKDSKYFEEVMNDPKLKKEYNERMLTSGF